MRNVMKWQYVRANEFFFLFDFSRFHRQLHARSRHRRSQKRCAAVDQDEKKKENGNKKEELCRNDNEKRERNLKWADWVATWRLVGKTHLWTTSSINPLQQLIDWIHVSFRLSSFLSRRFFSFFFSFCCLPFAPCSSSSFSGYVFLCGRRSTTHRRTAHKPRLLNDRSNNFLALRSSNLSFRTDTLDFFLTFFFACFSVFFNFSILFSLSVGTQFQSLNKNR